MFWLGFVLHLTVSVSATANQLVKQFTSVCPVCHQFRLVFVCLMHDRSTAHVQGTKKSWPFCNSVTVQPNKNRNQWHHFHYLWIVVPCALTLPMAEPNNAQATNQGRKHMCTTLLTYKKGLTRVLSTVSLTCIREHVFSQKRRWLSWQSRATNQSCVVQTSKKKLSTMNARKVGNRKLKSMFARSISRLVSIYFLSQNTISRNQPAQS